MYQSKESPVAFACNQTVSVPTGVSCYEAVIEPHSVDKNNSHKSERVLDDNVQSHHTIAFIAGLDRHHARVEMEIVYSIKVAIYGRDLFVQR